MNSAGPVGLVIALALATPVQGAPCESTGEKSGRAVELDHKKDTVGYVTWVYAVDPVMNRRVLDLAKPEITCERGTFQAAGETYILTGENDELFPRRAIPTTEGKPVLFVAPVTDLTKRVSAGLGVKMKYTPGASYVLIWLDTRSARAVRVYKRLPADDTLLADFARVLETGGQPFARMQLPDGDVEIVVSSSKD